MSLFSLNDQCVTLTGLVNKITGEFVVDATVSVTLQKDDVDVVGESWPLAMPYVADSDGVYRAIIESTVDIVNGDKVRVSVEVSTPLGGNAMFVADEHVRSRSFDGT